MSEERSLSFEMADPDGEVGTARIDEDAALLVNPDEVLVTGEPRLIILYSYPLHGQDVLLPFRSEDGNWTRRAIFEAVQAGYRKVYEEPVKHGIWGHGIEDLFLEGLRVRGPAVELDMGS